MKRSNLHGALLLVLAGCSADSSAPPSNNGGSGQNNKPDASMNTSGGSGGSDVTGGSGGNSDAGSSGTGGTGGSATGGAGDTGQGGSSAGGSGGTVGGSGGASMGGAGGMAGAADASGGSSGGGNTGDGGVLVANGFAVETNNYDNARSGANVKETILTTSNVAPGKFGLLFSRTIVGASYGQPLYVSGVMINGTKRNVVYVATEENNVYAFDADSPTASAPLWSKNLGATLNINSAAFKVNCNDMLGSNDVVGVTSTPVISVADNKIFVAAKGPGTHTLHSLDLATGMPAPGSPANIGTGMADFDPNIHLNRPGLLLSNGIIYVAYGSHCDNFSYHGWIFGYDAKTLTRKMTFNATPDGSRGAIWQSGVGLSTDGTSIYASIGNGSFTGSSVGFSYTSLSSALVVTHKHTISATGGDADPSSGMLLLGDTNQVAAGGKDFKLLLMGKDDLAVKQTVTYGGGGRPEVHSLVFWNGSVGPMLYSWPDDSPLYSYAVGAGTLKQTATNAVRKPAHPGGTLTLSSNGKTPGTGILWATVPEGDAWHSLVDGSFYAFDASDISKAPLWDSTVDPKDDVGKYAKFSSPTVANGKVYLATFSGKLQVYGLK